MIEKISSLNSFLRQSKLDKYANITKIAIDLINKTDGSLSIKDIVDIEQLAFGVAFQHTGNSLSSQVNEALDSDEIDDFIFENQEIFKEVIADKIPGKYLSALTDSVVSSFLESVKKGKKISLNINEDEAKRIELEGTDGESEAVIEEKQKGFFGGIKDSISSIKDSVTNKINKLMYEAYSEAKKKAVMYLLNTPIANLEKTIGKEMIDSILYQLSSEELEEGDEFVVFGSKDAYLLLGIGDTGGGEIEAEIYDMSADKSSPDYMNSMRPLFLEALKYAHSKGASELSFTARESTSHALLSVMLLDEKRRRSFLSEKKPDSEKVYHHDKVKSIDVERYPRFLQTKESEFASNLVGLFNSICIEIRSPEFYRKKAEEKKANGEPLGIYGEGREVSIDRINKLIEKRNFSGEGSYCDTMDINPICLKLSEIKTRVVDSQHKKSFIYESEKYIAELKEEILNFLRKNKNDHYGMEDYFGYTIELNQ